MPIFSLEIFPPKHNLPNFKIQLMLKKFQQMHPAFTSVTLGTNGTIQNQNTIDVANYLQNNLKIPAMVHLPGRYQTKAQVISVLKRLDQINVHQILALQGNQISNLASPHVFEHANQLINFIHSNFPSFIVASACYPSNDIQFLHDEMPFLRLKRDAGSTQMISQLFFDNQSFYHLQKCSDDAYLNIPIEAGIMPCTSVHQLKKMSQMSHATIPKSFAHNMNVNQDDLQAMKQIGIQHAIDQIHDLVEHNVHGIHLYSMNQIDVAQSIWDAVKSDFI
ncbi:methylenetetrahydrofolate reductase [Philodulcilactobacillus myokoensis]|uniref:Methylenetetrahydrofolate reductase n=1 Tax=Philodulcilactobacillus myokoensis TaxID=2929573 RepID=A0A9W6B2U3_9LACO|nr:methylenetetrahydrofolate reductase [Philodulcilactobacillus myokoensis]GLB47446.1 methylenetetrahydrofolate reductase [Philodulcilactobacillus myokoensis]